MRHFPLVDLFMLNEWFPVYEPDDNVGSPVELDSEETRERKFRELGIL